MKIEMPAIPDVLPLHAIFDWMINPRPAKIDEYQAQPAPDTIEQRQYLVSRINDLCDCCDV